MNDDDENEIASAIRQLARAITPSGAASGHDATGGTVGSLTEATMGITAGLVRIAESLDAIKDSLDEIKEAIPAQDDES